MAFLLVLVAAAPAAIVEFTVNESNELTLPPVFVSITISDMIGGVEIAAHVEPTVEGSGAVGDLLDLYFNYAIAPPTSVNVDVSSFAFGLAGQTDLEVTYSVVNGQKVGPIQLSEYAMLFAVNEGGIGANGYDIRWVIMATSGGDPSPLSASMFLSAAARLQSVTDDSGTREGSLWLTTPDYPTPPNQEEQIPEPGTWLMLGAGLSLLAMARRRR